MALDERFDVVVVGGGPAGATAACDLAKLGRKVALLDKAGRIKPCGGAIPPRAIRDFEVPQHLLKARVSMATMISPKGVRVDMPIEGGYVGMVDRAEFDEFLRARAAQAGASRVTGEYEKISRDAEGTLVHYKPKGETELKALRTKLVIGADGALTQVGRQEVPGADRTPYVFAYHEIVETPAERPDRCEIYYKGTLSPDFYAWVFPHGETMSVGTGSAHKGFSLRQSVALLRKEEADLGPLKTIRKEGAPIPLKPMKRWDNGRDVLLCGDAAGTVAPASGEGIYYALLGGRLAAEATDACLKTGDVRQLATARKRFMKAHGRVFWILGILQYFWYRNDALRESFVSICRDKDVQKLTWESYMNKELQRRDPMAHVRIFFKDLAHLLRLVSP